MKLRVKYGPFDYHNQLHSFRRVKGLSFKEVVLCIVVLMSFSGDRLSVLSDSSTAQPTKEVCSTDRLQKCMNLLQTINTDINLAFASTEDELNNMCNTMNSGLQCVYDHVTRCFDAKRRQFIHNLLEGTEHVIHLLCTPGKFRERYKIHAPCMKNVSTDPRMCGPQYQMLIHSVNPKDDVSRTDTIRRQCCTFHIYLLCVTEVAESECGRDASYFIKDYSYRTAGPLIKNQCKNYKAGSLMCSLSNSQKSSLHSSTLIFVLIFLVMSFNQ